MRELIRDQLAETSAGDEDLDLELRELGKSFDLLAP
jgi:hypothetical protein